MTLIDIHQTVPDGEVGNPEAPAKGHQLWKPRGAGARRRAEDPSREVREASFRVDLLSAGITTIEVAPTDGTWAWTVHEYVEGTSPTYRAIAVPDVARIDFRDCPQVDLRTLDPVTSKPDPIWVQKLATLTDEIAAAQGHEDAAALAATQAAASAQSAANSASAASGSAGTATTEASGASTSATNAAASSSTASTSATNAAASASAANVSATNADAAKASAAGSAQSAAASASSASTSATTATTKASEAASSASAASASESKAATGAGTASTKATEATNSATAAAASSSTASTSATNAAASASAANVSATNAATSADAAEADRLAVDTLRAQIQILTPDQDNPGLYLMGATA